MRREEIQEQRAQHQRPLYRQQQSSPHHVGTNVGMHSDAPYTTDDVLEEEEVYDDPVYPRMNSTARRYEGAAPQVQTRQQSRSPIPARRSRQPVQDLANHPAVVNIGGQYYRLQDHGTAAPPTRRGYQPPIADRQTEEHVPIPEPESQPQRQTPHAPRFHWLFWIGIAFCTMLIGWIVFTLLGSFVQLKYDDALYGRPRTFQIDAVVGHQDSPASPSHFECVNLHKQIQMIEFPGGNSSKAKIYQGPTLLGPGSELTVCTLSFQDVNGDGKPDMVLTIGKEIFVMINDGTGFRNVKAEEHINL